MSDLLAALDTLKASGLSNETVVEVATDLLDNDLFEDNDDKKIVALIVHTSGSLDVEDCRYDTGCAFTADGKEYLVLDEDEVESRIDDCLDNLLDDTGCVEGADSPYFDRERWKKDARMDGAGHIIGSYDGNEDEYSDLTVFRTN
jgi:hypothetical protein